jgi:hypothetical protein
MDEDGAAEAYDSYASSLGWRLADGQPLLPWNALPEGQRQAWLVAMDTARDWIVQTFDEHWQRDLRAASARWN